uniref:Salivary lipocalin n=1 Tax=Triatoma infestans TaxID=30076 RepID=A6YPD6_TRIIF|nr:salivary lipocalin [Triatoma infestans]
MKTIIAVVLIGILTYAFAETADKIEKCQEVSPMENFDSTKLRRGTWFMTRAKNGTSSTLCQKFKFEHDSENNLIVRYGFHISEEFYKARCNCTKEGKEGKYSSNCTLTNMKGESGNFQAYFVIIATDYENYAIVYRCVKKESEIIGDNFLILIPNRAAIKHEEIKKLLLDKLNLRLKDFRTRQNQKCKRIQDNMF